MSGFFCIMYETSFANSGGTFGLNFSIGVGCRLQVPFELGVQGVGGKRRLVREHLIEAAAELIDVAARIGAPPAMSSGAM